MSPREALAVDRVRCASNLSGSTGSSALRSVATNAASRLTPAISEPTVSTLVQPADADSTRPNTMRIIPAVDVIAPTRSKRP